MNYKLKNKVLFHEETHTYLPTKNEYDKFIIGLEKYVEKKEKEKQKPDIHFWASSQGWRYGALTSTTKLLSKVFPFTGGNNTITKAWLNKILKKGIISPMEFDKMIFNLEQIESVLDRDMTNAQEDGTLAHEQIQEFIDKEFKNESSDVSKLNKYANKFVIDYKTNDTGLQDIFKGIRELLPCEVPVAYKDPSGKLLYTGMWDGLFKNNNGEFVLIDIKTGSPVVSDKLLKVEHQLNAYNNLIKNNLGINVSKHYCVEIAERWNDRGDCTLYTKVHSFKPKAKTWFEMLFKYEELEKIKKGA